MIEINIAQLRALIANDEIPPLPWETDDEMGVLALDGRHCIGELSPQIVADFVVYVVNNLPALCDEVERFQSGMMREANRVVELLNENSDLKAENETLKRAVTIATLVMGNLINKVPVTDDDMQWARDKIAELDKEWNNDY